MILPSVSELSILLIALIIIMVVCIKTKKLSVTASLAAGLIGLLIFTGAGYTGILMLGAFFVMGVLATGYRKDKKAVKGVHQQQRNAGQVLANGGMAAILATIAIFDHTHANTYIIMLAASLAAATADTLSSELGMVYGRNFYNILTFKREPKGLDGVISMEGTLIGGAGALIIAVIYSFANGIDNTCLIITLAGVVGNLADSILGAALERKHFIGNDAVNFLNTFVAALVALMFM
ncbi:TIGR00297 family protein [Chitinophaga sp. CF118]|uniref:DUF92 domain-containing protein n=1 Tax=Chitinophaga sp. CF118 TaxID=1884367 RepID=UPI0008F36281|nr:DUF92 domain-containing protein [Chitinophaga sp. CF118]SFD88622.1 TIGR00297 family protein [Chitinophaga sp. CF118]